MAEFEAAASVYGAATDRVATGFSYRVYQVTAGMPEPTFLVFASVASYAQFDVLDRCLDQLRDEPLRAPSDDEVRVGGNARHGSDILDAKTAGVPRPIALCQLVNAL